MKIGDRHIGAQSRPYLLAEMSGNHNKSLERALSIVEAAAGSGADGIKIQTYTADSMTMNIDKGEFLISDPKSLWFGRTLYDVYSEASTPYEWHAPIMERARDLGMQCFSTPFDEAAVDFLEGLDVPAYKIASFECIDLPLIRKVAETGKPLIISTGMATLAEIDEAVATARDAGNSNIILLKCTSTYPASPENSNVRTIPHLRDLFGCEVGLSDHTLGIGVPLAATAMGATFIERHFTLAREDGGVDAAFSMEPDEFRTLVVETSRAWESLGTIKYGPTKAEEKARLRRRSLYITRDLSAGDPLTTENMRRLRPGLGLPPKYEETLLGRKIAVDVKAGTPVTWDILGEQNV